MMAKLRKIFDSVTINSNSQIVDQQQFEYLTSKLLERKLIIEQDLKLFSIYIKDFPITFQNLASYIYQIYKLDIENLIETKTENHEQLLSNINKFLSFITSQNLTNDDIVQILTSLIKNKKVLNNAIINFKKSEFIIKNIRDDIQKFLWERIQQTMENKTEEYFQELDVVFSDPEEYQHRYQDKIQVEYEIVRVKKFHEKTKNFDKNPPISKKIISTDAYCSDRNILIKCFKIPNIFYDRNLLESFYYKCEASKELLLSKHFIKFLGYEDCSSDDYQFYFFENLQNGIKIIPFFNSIETENPETSFFFKYLAKEILCSFRDLLNKCTYSFKFPITADNIYYDKQNFRLYLDNIKFGSKRKSIMESHQIVEVKLLYFYGMILLNMLSIKYPGLSDLINLLNEKCSTLEEFSKMQKIFDCINAIEDYLTKNLENDIVICIIMECLLTPYKAKLVFDEFYEKKNFLESAIKSRHLMEKAKGLFDDKSGNEGDDIKPIKRISNLKNMENDRNSDKRAVMSPYFEGGKEMMNEESIKRTLTINMLLVHPFYSNTNLDEQFLKFLFKEKEKEERKDEYY